MAPDVEQAMLDGDERIERDEHDDSDKPRAPLKLGLCLSGGGYRAMLFHAGVLVRLAELGLLAQLDRIASVSGGSITAGRLAVAWPRLEARGFTRDAVLELVVEPLRKQSRVLIDVPASLFGALPFVEAGSIVRRGLGATFEHKKLGDLPQRPRFDFLATNLQSGKLFRFAGTKGRDYRVGEVELADLDVAVAVAASAAFPPLLAPVTLKLKNVRKFEKGCDLHRPPFTEKAVLVDGGVYDNQGLEPVFENCTSMIISDGGSPFPALERPSSFWPALLMRTLFIMDSQVHALRRRLTYKGRITKDAALIAIDRGPAGDERATRMSRVGTQLRRFPERTEEELIDWGYTCAADTMMKRWPSAIAAPSRAIEARAAFAAHRRPLDVE